MYKRKIEVVIFWTLVTLIHTNVEAGPMKRLSRMVREVYPEIDPENEGNQAQVCIVGDVVYGTDEPVPAEQPCLKCRCQPPGVQCETLQCEKRPGCKAIHKPNKCCPDYQCECEHNGRFYANGEKLETPPGGECKVCYCRGGEVQCAEVSCYVRKDCEGKRVPGKCCPKFDHCPPIDPVPGRPPYTTETTLLNINKDIFEPWPIVGVSSNATDNILNLTSNDIQDENKIPGSNDYETTTSAYKAAEIDDLQKEAEVGLHHKITIQEIIPERKEIPITAPPKVEMESQGTLIIEEADEFLNHSNDLVVTDSDADSSEISEVFQQPPPVLRIGDKLLFLKKGEFIPENDTSTPNSIITVIGAEGLQRGFEESGEIHEVKIENLPKENDNEFDKANATIAESNYQNLNPEKNNDFNNYTDTNISELNTASSTHILSLLKRKTKPSSTTTQTPTTTSTSESQPIISTTDVNLLLETSTLSSTTIQEPTSDNILSSTTKETDAVTTLDISDNLTTEEIKNVTEIVPLNGSESELKETTTILSSTRRYDPLLDHNPAYPPLPEIMGPNIDDASQRFDLDNIDNGTDSAADNITLPTLKILPDVLGIRSNKTVPQNITNNEWLKSNHDTLINYKATLPDDLLNQPAPTDIEDTTEVDVLTTTLLSTSEVMPTTTLVSDTGSSATDTVSITTEGQLVGEIATTLSDFSEKIEENPRSVETVEDISADSGESTTKKNSHASIVSNENASIEEKNADSTEAEDMVSTKKDANDNSGEETTQSDTSLIDKEWDDKTKNTTSNANSKDVEIIDTSTLKKKKPIERNIEDISELETMTEPQRIIGKRESSQKDQLILKELYEDLTSDVTEQNLTSDEEQKDSDAIFKELLENTTTPKTAKIVGEPRNKETETLQRVSEALTKFSLTGKEPDSGILGTLIKFFNSQYEPYSRK